MLSTHRLHLLMLYPKMPAHWSMQKRSVSHSDVKHIYMYSWIHRAAESGKTVKVEKKMESVTTFEYPGRWLFTLHFRRKLLRKAWIHVLSTWLWINRRVAFVPPPILFRKEIVSKWSGFCFKFYLMSQPTRCWFVVIITNNDLNKVLLTVISLDISRNELVYKTDRCLVSKIRFV